MRSIWSRVNHIVLVLRAIVTIARAGVTDGTLNKIDCYFICLAVSRSERFLYCVFVFIATK